MKITVCAKCGSQDLERLGWVSLRTNQFVGDFEEGGVEPDTYCNDCGERQPTVDREYTVCEKYDSVYRLQTHPLEGQTIIMVAPIFKDGGIDTKAEYEVDLDNAFNVSEREEFYAEMKEIFAGDAKIEKIFQPYIRRYAGIWFSPVYEPAVKMLTADAFNEDKGYEQADIDIISKMQVGDVAWFGAHPIASKTHLVTRVS